MKELKGMVRNVVSTREATYRLVAVIVAQAFLRSPKRSAEGDSRYAKRGQHTSLA